MESCVETKIKKMGYRVNTKPYGYINVANMWYRNEIIDDFHKRTTIQGEQYEIERMGFAKRGCADDANLCEIININMGTKEQTAAVNKILGDNRFNVMYRKQLEHMSATGTVAAYIRLEDTDEFFADGMDGATVSVKAYGDNDTFGCWSDDTKIVRFRY